MFQAVRVILDGPGTDCKYCTYGGIQVLFVLPKLLEHIIMDVCMMYSIYEIILYLSIIILYLTKYLNTAGKYVHIITVNK